MKKKQLYVLEEKKVTYIQNETIILLKNLKYLRLKHIFDELLSFISIYTSNYYIEFDNDTKKFTIYLSKYEYISCHTSFKTYFSNKLCEEVCLNLKKRKKSSNPISIITRYQKMQLSYIKANFYDNNFSKYTKNLEIKNDEDDNFYIVRFFLDYE